jgi:hypothetical protein
MTVSNAMADLEMANTVRWVMTMPGTRTTITIVTTIAPATTTGRADRSSCITPHWAVRR